jgi:hypothetical protein
MGETWLPRLIMATDKTKVKGDILIDDKPMETLAPGGPHTLATWEQVVFEAPYNHDVANVRLSFWEDWREAVDLCLQTTAGARGRGVSSTALTRREARSDSISILDNLMDSYNENKRSLKNRQSMANLLSLLGQTDSSAQLNSLKDLQKSQLAEYDAEVARAVQQLVLGGEAEGSLQSLRPSYKKWENETKGERRPAGSKDSLTSMGSSDSLIRGVKVMKDDDGQEVYEIQGVIIDP